MVEEDGGKNAKVLENTVSKRASRSEKPRCTWVNESPAARSRDWEQDNLEKGRKCHLDVRKSSPASLKFYPLYSKIKCHE